MDERPRRPLGEALKGFLSAGLEILQTRLELLIVEVQEEKLRLASFLFNSVLAALFIGFGLLFLAAFLTVLWWDEHRLVALGIATVIFLGMGVVTAGSAAKRLKGSARMFAATLAELAKDREALRRHHD